MKPGERRVPRAPRVNVLLSDVVLNLRWIITFAILIAACAALSIIGLAYR